MENKKIDIEMADMVGKTYLQIATWFNKDFETAEERQKALKHVSAEIIQTILEDTFLQLDGVSTETKTITNELAKTPEQPKNETSSGTGKMFTASEDIIINALKQEK